MKPHKSSLNRRQALKNLSGCIAAPLLMPFANRLTAEARGELPRRFLFVIKSSGLTPAELVPKDLIPEDNVHPLGPPPYLIGLPLGAPTDVDRSGVSLISVEGTGVPAEVTN